MSLWDELSKLISSFRPINLNISINNPQLNITNDSHSELIECNESKNTLDINYQKLDDNTKGKFREIIVAACDKEDTVLMEKESEAKIKEFKEEENSSDTQKILEFLKFKIPQEDVKIWRAALYLRNKFRSKSNSESIKQLKREIMQKYGERGRNIANLCTAGYLEKFLQPLYNALLEEKENEKIVLDDFKKVYELIVKELPFTVFVSIQMTKEEIKNEILKRKNFGTKFVNMHGIGRDNINNIKDVIKQLEEKMQFKRRTEEEGNTIFVRISFS